MRGLVFGFLCLGSVLVAPIARAQNDVERDAARSLATQGIEALRQGRVDEAVESLERANQLAPIPTIGLWLARALQKRGKLLEASERYQAVGRYKVRSSDPDVFSQAQDEAQKEGAELAPRIPKLTVRLLNADQQLVSLALDGAVLSSALIGVPFSVNPGQRTVAAKVGAREARQQWNAKDGESQTLIFDFGARQHSAVAEQPQASSSSPMAATVPSGPTGSPAPASDSSIQTSNAPRSRGVLPYVVLTAGGGALVTGAVFGVVALGQSKQLEQDCPNKMCPPKHQGNLEVFERNKLISIVGLGVGAVGVGVGLYLLLSGGEKPADAASVSPWLGLGAAGVRGRF